MSVEALTWAFKVKLNNPGAKFVLIALSNYADENGECYPSVSHLNSMTGISERTIQEHLVFLESKDLILRTKRRNEEGHFTSNIYQVRNPHLVEANQPRNPQSVQPRNPPTAKFAPYTKENKEDTKEENTQKESVRVVSRFDRLHSSAVALREIVGNESKTGYPDLAWQWLSENHPPSPFEYQDWETAITHTHTLTDNPELFAECFTWIKNWATGRITPKMVANNFGKFLADIKKNGNGIKTLNCKICSAHPDRDKLKVKENGWIWTTNGIIYCVCNPKHKNNQAGATNGKAH